jgi:ATP-dependent protease Clp ATPase subunit
VDDFKCSFCEKKRTAVRKLVSGPMVFICDSCAAERFRIAIAASVDPVQVHKAQEADPNSGAKSSATPRGVECSFCRRSDSESEMMFDGPTRHHICVGCIGLCDEICSEEIGTDWKSTVEP